MVIGLDWKSLVEPVMKHYTDVTDGSYIEAKETALVWHYEEADPDFGSCQAKDLQDHLLSVLAKEPVCVKSGHKIVEVNPQVRKHLKISRASFLGTYCYATLHHSEKGITILYILVCTLSVGSHFTFQYAQAKTKRTSLKIPPVDVMINQV